MTTETGFPAYGDWEVDMSKKEVDDECAANPLWSLSYEDNGIHMHYDPEEDYDFNPEPKIYSRCSVSRLFEAKKRPNVEEENN